MAPHPMTILQQHQRRGKIFDMDVTESILKHFDRQMLEKADLQKMNLEIVSDECCKPFRVFLF